MVYIKDSQNVYASTLSESLRRYLSLKCQCCREMRARDTIPSSLLAPSSSFRRYRPLKWNQPDKGALRYLPLKWNQPDSGALRSCPSSPSSRRYLSLNPSLNVRHQDLRSPCSLSSCSFLITCLRQPEPRGSTPWREACCTTKNFRS
jgi:hypothetical protein